MIYVLRGCCIMALLVSSSVSIHRQPRPSSKETAPKAKSYTYIIPRFGHNSFSYDVFEDGKLLIRQPLIPGLAGNTPFKTSADAGEIAKLVLKKLKPGPMSPTVSTKELDELQIKS